MQQLICCHFYGFQALTTLLLISDVISVPQYDMLHTLAFDLLLYQATSYCCMPVLLHGCFLFLHFLTLYPYTLHPYIFHHCKSKCWFYTCIMYVYTLDVALAVAILGTTVLISFPLTIVLHVCHTSVMKRFFKKKGEHLALITTSVSCIFYTIFVK